MNALPEVSEGETAMARSAGLHLARAVRARPAVRDTPEVVGSVARGAGWPLSPAARAPVCALGHLPGRLVTTAAARSAEPAVLGDVGDPRRLHVALDAADVLVGPAGERLGIDAQLAVDAGGVALEAALAGRCRGEAGRGREERGDKACSCRSHDGRRRRLPLVA
jgi:hypothetical protein